MKKLLLSLMCVGLATALNAHTFLRLNKATGEVNIIPLDEITDVTFASVPLDELTFDIQISDITFSSATLTINTVEQNEVWFGYNVVPSDNLAGFANDTLAAAQILLNNLVGNVIEFYPYYGEVEDYLYQKTNEGELIPSMNPETNYTVLAFAVTKVGEDYFANAVATKSFTTKAEPANLFTIAFDAQKDTITITPADEELDYFYFWAAPEDIAAAGSAKAYYDAYLAEVYEQLGMFFDYLLVSNGTVKEDIAGGFTADDAGKKFVCLVAGYAGNGQAYNTIYQSDEIEIKAEWYEETPDASAPTMKVAKKSFQAKKAFLPNVNTKALRNASKSTTLNMNH